MSQESESIGSPLSWAGESVASAWRTVKSIYYADTLSWRFLKSGALVFLGFFLWAGSNLLLSYQRGWTWLHYPMAYGFLVLVYGPFHHFVVIPLALRWRRSGGRKTRLGRRLPNAGLAVFLVAVVVLGSAPAAAGPMQFDFQSSLESAGADVNPDLLCTKSTDDGGRVHVHCHLTESAGVDHVAVVSGGEEVRVDEDPPFDFDVHEDELTEVAGQRQFQVVLRDAEGNTVRRYTRTLAMVPEG